MVRDTRPSNYRIVPNCGPLYNVNMPNYQTSVCLERMCMSGGSEKAIAKIDALHLLRSTGPEICHDMLKINVFSFKTVSSMGHRACSSTMLLFALIIIFLRYLLYFSTNLV